MKHLLLSITLFTALSVFSQGKVVIQQLNYTCEEGVAQAQEDFSNDKYTLTTYGLIVSVDWGFDKLYKDLIKHKYAITLNNGGCLVDGAKLCYYDTMKALLLKKFGDDIFEKSKVEAQLLYDKKKKS